MPTPNPTFTIITATFNAAATLERTLRSVERQTCDSVEHLIMDGASTDATLQLARAYAERQPQRSISVVSEPDSGLYDAFNKGIARARGTYIVFLNAGDTLHADDTLATIAAALPCDDEARLPAVVYGETDIVDADGTFLRHRRLTAPRRLTWKSFQQGMRVCHQSFYALRTLVPTYDLQYRFSADFDWCVRVLKSASEQHRSTLRIDAVLTDYLAEGLTTQNHRASLRERYRIMAHHYGRLRTLLLHGWFVLRAVFKR